jgi:hypothetical protein
MKHYITTGFAGVFLRVTTYGTGEVPIIGRLLFEIS